MKVAIIYRSKYGATECYAQWLSEKLACDIFNAKTVDTNSLTPYETIIFGSPIYVGRILSAKWIKKQWELFKGKKKYLFIVGSMFPENKEEINQVITTNFDDSYLEEMPWFYLRGRAVVEKLNIKDKTLISFVSKFEKDEKLKNMLIKGFDNMDEKNINEIVNAILKE